VGSKNGNDQWKMPDEGYNVNMHIIFYGLMLLGNIVKPFRTVLLKQSKFSNRAVTMQ